MNLTISTTKIGQEEGQTVSAREVHAFVESKQDFSDWIKARIKKYGFAENEDFTVHKFMDGDNAGRFASVEYFITFDMAKELGMVEANEKGQQIRRYFIAMEKEAKRLQQLTITNQRQSYLELKGEIGSDVVEYYTNKLNETEHKLSLVERERNDMEETLSVLSSKPSGPFEIYRAKFIKSIGGDVEGVVCGLKLKVTNLQEQVDRMDKELGKLKKGREKVEAYLDKVRAPAKIYSYLH